MQLLDNNTSVATGNTYTLQAKGLPAGFFVRRFWLRVDMTLVRGVGAVDHQPEAVAEVVQRVFSNQGRLRYDLGGRDILVLHNQQYRSRCSQNAILGLGDTEYQLYIPIDPSPFAGYPGDSGDRMKTSKLQNQTFNITLQNPFTIANDVTTLTINGIYLYGNFTHVGPSEEKDYIATFARVDSITTDVETIDTVQPAILLLESRTDYDTMDITATDTVTNGGLVIAQDADALRLDAKDEEYDVYLSDDADRASAGNQLLIDVPKGDGTATSFTKAVDIRNDKTAAPPYRLKFMSKTANIPYLYAGYIVG